MSSGNGYDATVIDLRDVPDEEPDPYTEVAKRFFYEFLQLKAAGAVPPGERVKEHERHERQRRKLEEAIDVWKNSAASLAAENERLEQSVVDLMAEREDLRCRLNNEIVRRAELASKLKPTEHIRPDGRREYRFDQHMSEEAFHEWQRIMAEIPRPGH